MSWRTFRIALAVLVSSPIFAGPSLAQAIDRTDVEMTQRRLNALGYQAGEVDGILGPRTRSALRAWQADAGLAVTGELTPAAIERLETARTAPAAADLTEAEMRRMGMLSSAVRNVQRQLKEAGYDVGPVDGVPGPRTRAAIRRYQQAQDLPATGRISSSLLAQLEQEETREYEVEAILAGMGRLDVYVRDIQQELRDHGFYAGGDTGEITPGLRAAIRDYQAAADLPVTGQVTEALLDHLRFSRPEIVSEQRARRE